LKSELRADVCRVVEQSSQPRTGTNLRLHALETVRVLTGVIDLTFNRLL
jgi:hypothetical protein